ncbi:MAG: hypothetical protein JNL79_14045 [Myxococcales bacterium]|nr:hypothetical protein [Myxococcales bacterium]
MRPLACLLPVLLAACGSEVSETIVDASTDTTTEAASDAALDTTTVDTRPDTVADTAPADVPGETSDAPVDASIPDTGVATSAACSAAGGVLCTAFRWNICPAGFEPVSSTDHLGCGTAGGWCCRPAPPSPCAASGLGNCLPTCPLDCWQPVTDTTLTCDGARKCCRDVCK